MKANSDQISLPIVSKGTTNKPNSYRTKPNYSTNNRKEKLNSIKENKSIAPVSKSAGRVTPFVDAETGEPLKFSLARWNNREGRVNLDGRTIIEMGTGRLDISRRVQANPSTSSIASYNSSTISCIDSPNKSPDNCNYVSFATDSITINSPESVGNRIHNHSISCGTYAQSDSGTVQTRHPLLTQYLKTGPINIKHNKYWNPRTNTVIVPKSEQDFDDEIDGAVSNGNDGDKRTAGSQNDSWNDSYSTFSVNESLDSYPFSNSAIDDLKYLDDTNRRESSSPLIEHNNSIRDSVVSTPSKISSLRPVFRELITLNPKIGNVHQLLLFFSISYNSCSVDYLIYAS